MATKDTSLPPKFRRGKIEATPPADDNMDPSRYQWCPEMVEIMADFGQTPADMIVSDNEDEIDIQKDEHGELFPMT